MRIIDFTEELIPEAIKLALENYEEERQVIGVLPETAVLPSLEHLAHNGMGAAAVDGNTLLGFIGAYGPWEPVFYTQTLRGVFSPVHAHGAVKENRVRIYREMYQHAAEKWVREGASSHAVSLYAHDLEAHEAFFVYGFGMRCMDLMCAAEKTEQLGMPDCVFYELPSFRQQELRELRMSLADHLALSPCFMKDMPEVLDEWLRGREQDPPRTFAAEINGRICAYMEIKEEGENFISSSPGTMNICGAYCLPEYRGKGIAHALLRHVISVLYGEGIARMGVDCESFNPTALNFWTKHFSEYTHSVVRRIDENAVDFRRV